MTGSHVPTVPHTQRHRWMILLQLEVCKARLPTRPGTGARRRSHLKTFGCIAYTKELNQLGKLDDRGKPGVFIGYAEGAKAW